MFSRAFRYEMHKLVHMQSAWVLSAVTAAMAMLPIVFGSRYYRDEYTTAVPLSEFDPVALVTSQIAVAATFMAVLGIIFTCFEFKGGAERGTLLAFPQRRVSFAAKVASAALFVGVFASILVPVGYYVSRSLLGTHALGLGEPGVIRSLCGAVVFMVAITVFAMGLAYTLRSSAGAIGILVPTMLFVSTMLSNVPIEWIADAVEFLPDLAGSWMMRIHIPEWAVLGPLTGALVLAAWVVGFGGLGLSTLVRQDVDA